MYHFSSRILKFKESESKVFIIRTSKITASARNVKHTRAMLKGNVVILKEDGIYPNPLTL